jgi:predicted NACHT family NTPase
MADIYIERELIVDRDATQEHVAEADIISLGFPLVVLGDPGIGKTKFTESLAARLGGRRLSSGTFIRSANLETLRPPDDLPIIIDGLDELAASSGTSAVDEVLKKLSSMGSPPFILSCRAADWNGSTDRHKIREDYGIEPTTATLKAFSRSDAKRFLSCHHGIDPGHLLEELDRRDLSEFYTNPLTLKLIAEIATDHQGLPNGRADLFDRASRILVLEDDPVHQRGEGGMANPEILLDSSGAIFAHLLLSGSLGIADLPISLDSAGLRRPR